MLKLIIAVLFLFYLPQIATAQADKKNEKVFQTKMDVFSSRTGTIVKFIDTKLPDIKSSFTSAETRIRKIFSGGDFKYFYQIIKQGQYTSSTASIEYSDLVEVNKAIQTLKVEANKDIAMNPDYLETKFVTSDGFQVGYYVEKGRISWYITLEKYGSDNTIFIKQSDNIESAFRDAQHKIEDLKK
jgi:hypothetical protein